MGIKTILGVGALAIGGMVYFGKDKYNQYNGVLKSLQFKIKGVKNIQLKNGNVSFDLDMQLVNPTATAIDVPGEKIVVKTLHFYTPTGKYLGDANTNLSNIDMPANGTRLITNIPVSLSLATIGNSFSEILTIISDTSVLKIKADMEAFGHSFTLNA